MDVANTHFIAGARRADSDTTFQARDAASGEPLSPAFPEATTAEIDAACAAAAEAAPAFADLAPSVRAAFLTTIADGLDARVEDFAAWTPRESGLPDARIRGELGRTTGQLRLFADVVRRGDFLGARIDRANPDRKPLPKPDVRMVKVPLGPVAVFGASNFPLAFSVAGGDTASALAAGCPVVVKAHPAHPATSALVAEVIAEAVAAHDLPAGVFSMVHGESHAGGGYLVQHPAIKAVAFTGSHKGGMALARLGAERDEPIPVFAEMGSINPVFLLPNALAARGPQIAAELVGSVTLGCGQFCTNPGIVFAVKGEPLDAAVAALGETMRAVAPGVMLHAGILAAYEQGRARLAAAEGVSLIAAGQAGDNRAQAAAYHTTLDRFRTDPALSEEIFGPVTLVVEVPHSAALAEAARAVPGQLTMTFHGDDDDLKAHAEVLRIARDKAGRVLLNGFPTGVEVCEAMVHGGPYPATTDSRFTSVGTLAIDRFLRPVSFQNMPDFALPPAVQDANPLGLRRLVDGVWES